MVGLNCQLLFGWGGGGGRGWLPPLATAPPNARLNPQLPIAVAIVHHNLAAVPPSFAPPPPPPIAIVLPVGRCHHCLPLKSCCRPPPPATAHTLLPLHAVARMPHPLPTVPPTLAACRPSQSFPQPPPPAAAHTHSARCHTHAAAAAYCCMHAPCATAPVTTATSAAAGTTSIDF